MQRRLVRCRRCWWWRRHVCGRWCGRERQWRQRMPEWRAREREWRKRGCACWRHIIIIVIGGRLCGGAQRWRRRRSCCGWRLERVCCGMLCGWWQQRQQRQCIACERHGHWCGRVVWRCIGAERLVIGRSRRQHLVGRLCRRRWCCWHLCCWRLPVDRERSSRRRRRRSIIGMRWCTEDRWWCEQRRQQCWRQLGGPWWHWT